MKEENGNKKKKKHLRLWFLGWLLMLAAVILSQLYIGKKVENGAEL